MTNRTDKLFEKNLIGRIISEIRAGDCVKGSKGFDSHLPLTERVNKNLKEKRQTHAIILGVTKAVDTIRVEGLLQTLTTLNFATYLVQTISTYLQLWRFQKPPHSVTSIRRSMQAGVAPYGLLSPVLFSSYVNDSRQLLAASSWVSK